MLGVPRLQHLCCDIYLYNFLLKTKYPVSIKNESMLHYVMMMKTGKLFLVLDDVFVKSYTNFK